MSDDIELDPKLPYAEKIAKLLRKAETTDSEAEADALTERAMALMVKYAINEQLLAQARGLDAPDTIEQHIVSYTGIFHMALFDIGRNVAKANNLRTLINRVTGKTQTDLYMIGYTKDIANAKLLDASVQVQASTAMQRWYREQDTTGRTPMEKSKMRREFLFGFAQGLAFKLDRAAKSGVEQAVAAETERTGDGDQARKSTDLVIISKKEKVDEWMDERYGDSLRSVRRNYSRVAGGYAARSAGDEAGRNANIGQPGIGGKRELGR
jgi:hypothetical protein